MLFTSKPDPAHTIAPFALVHNSGIPSKPSARAHIVLAALPRDWLILAESHSEGWRTTLHGIFLQ